MMVGIFFLNVTVSLGQMIWWNPTEHRVGHSREAFFNWIFYLFTFQMPAPFPVSPPKTPYPIPPHSGAAAPPPTTPPHPPTHSHHPALASPTLGHWTFTGPRASPPIDVWQGHPLLHMWLEPWVPPCVRRETLNSGSSGPAEVGVKSFDICLLCLLLRCHFERFRSMPEMQCDSF